jgi:peptidoglycan/LPS O-acetylase OafA/YrhL
LTKKLSYRPEIDGLRAVAVLPVLFFHAHLPFFQGGFIGVDVFFVISGYLITSIIVEEIEGRKFSIINFYERRARRILPSLFLIITFSMIASPFFLNPAQLENFGHSVVAVNFFVSNILFWQQSGYFGTASETSPLIHTWSLAVEEQFYIFFPIFLLLVLRYARKYLGLAIILAMILSLTIAEWGWRNSTEANFYLLPTRTWELLSGAIVALVLRNGCLDVLSNGVKNGISLISFTVLLSSLLFFNPNIPHPSLWTVLPVFATAGVIATSSNNNLVGRILSGKIFVSVGLISYSLYLWHQPLFAFAKLSVPENELPITLLFLILLSFALAFLSWKYWERPFRNKNIASRKFIFKFSIFGMLFLSAIGLFTSLYSDQIFFGIYPEKYANYKIIEEAASTKNMMINSECHIWSENFTNSFISRFQSCSIKYGKAVFITGGSHGMDLYNSIALGSDYPFIASVSRGFCRAHKFLGQENFNKCHYDDLIKFAKNNSKNIGYIIYTQTPDRLFIKSFNEAKAGDLSIESVTEVINYLLKLREISGTNVYMVGMLPLLDKELDSLLLSEDISTQLDILVSNRNINLAKYIDSIFMAKAEKASINYVSKIDAMGIDLSQDLFVNKSITYSDKRHLSTVGEKIFGKRLVAYLKRHNLFPSYRGRPQQ